MKKYILIAVSLLFNYLVGFSQGCVNNINTNPDPRYVSPNVNNFKKNTFDWTNLFNTSSYNFNIHKNGYNYTPPDLVENFYYDYKTYTSHVAVGSSGDYTTPIMTMHGNGIVSIGFPVDGTNWNTINNKLYPFPLATPQYQLIVNSGIAAKEVNVTASPWADYVFDKDYKLMTLKETEEYIKLNHHLPEIPSTEEVTKNGVNVGEIEAKLLKKVEELTLHVIKLQKELEQLQTSKQ